MRQSTMRGPCSTTKALRPASQPDTAAPVKLPIVRNTRKTASGLPSFQYPECTAFDVT